MDVHKRMHCFLFRSIITWKPLPTLTFTPSLTADEVFLNLKVAVVFAFIRSKQQKVKTCKAYIREEYGLSREFLVKCGKKNTLLIISKFLKNGFSSCLNHVSIEYNQKDFAKTFRAVY